MYSLRTDPYATNVLNPAIHSRLVADIETYANDARIMPEAIWTPMAHACGADEINYVKRFKFHRSEGIAGLVFTGKGDADIDGRMRVMAGALVRNFIRARVMVATELVDAIDDDGIPDMSALLLPNFPCSVRQWRRQIFVEDGKHSRNVLMHRRSIGVQTTNRLAPRTWIPV